MDGFNIRDGVLLKYTGKDTDVTVPDGVIIIGDNAFVMCENIKKSNSAGRDYIDRLRCFLRLPQA